MLLAALVASVAIDAAVRLRVAQAESPPLARPVVRITDDWRSDLLRELVRGDRFDEAMMWCDEEIEKLRAIDEEAAWWWARRTRVDAARRMTGDDFDDETIAETQGGIHGLLDSYPEHPRRLFLHAELRDVEFQAIRHDVIAAAIAPRPDPVTKRNALERDGTSEPGHHERAANRVARLSVELKRLIDEVRDRRVELDSGRGGSRRIVGGTDRDREDTAGRFAGTTAEWVADLMRLERRLLVRQVELALLSSELFPESSDDRVAAAAAAEGAATEALVELPPGTVAHQETRRLRAMAALRSGDPDRADSLLRRLEEDSPPSDPDRQALAVELAITTDRIDDALDRVRRYYGGAPDDAPTSLEMDLATLRLRLVSDDESLHSIGGWIDQIERRHGGYARRRAEALVLDGLRDRGDADRSITGGEVAVVAAQGRDRVRRGEPARGGQLLSAAARGATDADGAIRLAIESAAAFLKAGQAEPAAETLAENARRHPGAANSSAAMLQAAVVSARTTAPNAQTIESLLRETVTNWPESETAESARPWLARILVAGGNTVDAAEVLTRRPKGRITEGQRDEALTLWRDAIARHEPGDERVVCERFVEAIREPDGGEIEPTWRVDAVYLVDRETLRSLPPLANDSLSNDSVPESSNGPFDVAFDTFRRGRRESEPLRSPPDHRISDATWRLMRDARDEPSLRQPVAAIVEGWTNLEDSATDRARRLVWLDRVGDAVELFLAEADRSDAPGTIFREAATTLAASDRVDAREAAVDIWDRLAAGVPKGSAEWHQAKLAACELLARIGDGDEASRRARYVLLTDPPESTELRDRYDAVTRDR